MITVYDMASGIIHRVSNEASQTRDADNNMHQEQHDLPPHTKGQVALRMQEHAETTQDHTDKITPVIATVEIEQFIRSMKE